MYEEKEINYNKRKIDKSLRKNNNINKPKKAKKVSKNNQRLTIYNKINWKSIIKRLFILFIIMALLIFIISRINKKEQNKISVKEENMNTVINSSLNFLNEKYLPKNIDDSTSYILEELLEKNLLTPLRNEEGKACDYLKSYIIVNKINDNSYKLKVHLVCQEEEENAEKQITCSENCTIEK